MGTKRIFLQLDIVDLLKSLTPGSPVKNGADFTLIYNSGMMALGSSVADFTIGSNGGVEKDTIIYFTIMPMQLYSTAQLSFTYDFLNDSPVSQPSSATDPIESSYFNLYTTDKNPLSFAIQITSDCPSDEDIQFSLNATLNVAGYESISIVIDPKLRDQG